MALTKKIRILEEDIDKDYQNGYEICMMIDGDMIGNPPGANYSLGDFGEYHWVTYEGGLKILNSEKETESDYDKVKIIKFKRLLLFYRGQNSIFNKSPKQKVESFGT